MVHSHAWRIGKVLGIDLRIDHSWVIIAVLVAWSMFARLREALPAAAPSVLFPAAVLGALLLFGSVLVHEYSHALAAKFLGIPVKSITLFIFGGATHADVEAKGAGPELIVSLLGPVSSIILGIGFWISAVLASVAGFPIAGATLGYLGWINLVLAAFNLLPGFPLDGGRVLRSLVWAATRSLDKATRVAAVVGEAMGYGLLALGAFAFFGGNFLGGLWLAFIGWFLSSSARAYDEERQLRRLMKGVTAAEVMEPVQHVLTANMPLRLAVESYLAHSTQEIYPVLAPQDSAVLGIVTLDEVRETPREFWDEQTVGEIMIPLDNAVRADPETDMASLLKALEMSESGIALVFDPNGVPLGTVTAQDIAKWVRRRSLLVR
jgi:Zn-dependent protease